jgi:hypothetical protein
MRRGRNDQLLNAGVPATGTEAISTEYDRTGIGGKTP